MARQMVMFAADELRPAVREFVRERLCGFELRQAQRVARRERRRKVRGRQSAGGGSLEPLLFDEGAGVNGG